MAGEVGGDDSFCVDVEDIEVMRGESAGGGKAEFFIAVGVVFIDFPQVLGTVPVFGIEVVVFAGGTDDEVGLVGKEFFALALE